MKYFQQIANSIDVIPLALALQRNSDLWGQNTERKTAEQSPHTQMDDIWIRWRVKEELTSKEKYNEPHFAEWYPAYYKLPQLRAIIYGLMARVEAVHLGGVLLTKIPPGGEIAPHADAGWHPEFYNTKVYVPVQTNPGVLNIVRNETVVMRGGDAWVFNNTVTHSVKNHGQDDRITLIVCMRCEE